MMNFTDQTFIITGASAGIGKTVFLEQWVQTYWFNCYSCYSLCYLLLITLSVLLFITSTGQ